MKKKAMLLLAAAGVMMLTGCFGKGGNVSPNASTEEAEGSDWRTWGIIDGFGTLNYNGEDIDVCGVALTDCVEIYYDQEEQILFRQVEYPSPITEEQVEDATVSFDDYNGDDIPDVRVVVEGSDGVERSMTWIYDTDEYVYAAAFAYPPEEGAPMSDSEYEDLAIQQMDDLTTILGLLAGYGSISADESDNPIVEDGVVQYAKVTDGRLSSLEDWENFVMSTTCDDLRSEILDSSIGVFLEQDGALYVNVTNPQGYYIFPTEEGVFISDETDTEFTATTNMSSDMDGYARAHFSLVDGVWLISSYEFGQF